MEELNYLLSMLHGKEASIASDNLELGVDEDKSCVIDYSYGTLSIQTKLKDIPHFTQKAAEFTFNKASEYAPEFLDIKFYVEDVKKAIDPILVTIAKFYIHSVTSFEALYENDKLIGVILTTKHSSLTIKLA